MGRTHLTEPPARGRKRRFDIDVVMERLREAVKELPAAAMFALRDRGHGTPFEQLVGALLSARTMDEVTLPVCLRLFTVANTPEAMARLDEAEIGRLIRGVSFAEVKARDIRALSRRIVEEYGGVVPDTVEGLTALRGVGPKIAALTLGVGFGKAAISVDVHVQRIVNRWGYVHASTPEKTAVALAEVLPREYWIEINALCVPFGKHVCTGMRPRCSTCPVLAYCRQVGVVNPR